MLVFIPHSYFFNYTSHTHRKLDDHAIKLIKRYKNSLEEYFGDVTDDRLLAFAVNPILATEGCDDIQVLLGEEEGGDLKNRAEKLLAESILKIADKLLTDKSSSGNGDDNESPNGMLYSFDVCSCLYKRYRNTHIHHPLYTLARRRWE